MNRKKIYGFLAVLAIAALATVNVHMNGNKSDLSDIGLANVEALAQNENGGGMANECCPIWNITVQTSPTYSRSCTTGGQYKCENCNNCTN
jgi:hypothetical protein